jgi:hypothetical protein
MKFLDQLCQLQLFHDLARLHHNIHESFRSNVAETITIVRLEKVSNTFLSTVRTTVLTTLILFPHVKVMNYWVRKLEKALPAIDDALEVANEGLSSAVDVTEVREGLRDVIVSHKQILVFVHVDFNGSLRGATIDDHTFDFIWRCAFLFDGNKRKT